MASMNRRTSPRDRDRNCNGEKRQIEIDKRSSKISIVRFNRRHPDRSCFSA